MEKLKLNKICGEKSLNENLHCDDGKLQFVKEKATIALNFKRNQQHFTDLIPVDVDIEKDLQKAVPKRIAYEVSKSSKTDVLGDEDIMEFWTDDLITDNPNLDYDKDIDQEFLEPEISTNDTSYLTDLYFCKEIASQFR